MCTPRGREGATQLDLGPRADFAPHRELPSHHGDVDILVAAVPVPVIIGGSRIIAQVLRGRVA